MFKVKLFLEVCEHNSGVSEIDVFTKHQITDKIMFILLLIQRSSWVSNSTPRDILLNINLRLEQHGLLDSIFMTAVKIHHHVYVLYK